MSNDSSLDKDRLYFTQCNDTILLRCPECTSTKILRQCKIFHNFPGVWWHIKQDHQDILESRRDEVIQVLNCIFKAYMWNMFPKWAYSEAKIKATTTSSLLFNGKEPRADVLARLQDLARLFKISQFYPSFKQKQVYGLIKVVLGNVDERTMKKYFDCVTNNSKPDKINGFYDVTQFCNIVGV